MHVRKLMSVGCKLSCVYFNSIWRQMASGCEEENTMEWYLLTPIASVNSVFTFERPEYKRLHFFSLHHGTFPHHLHPALTGYLNIWNTCHDQSAIRRKIRATLHWKLADSVLPPRESSLVTLNDQHSMHVSNKQCCEILMDTLLSLWADPKLECYHR